MIKYIKDESLRIVGSQLPFLIFNIRIIIWLNKFIIVIIVLIDIFPKDEIYNS